MTTASNALEGGGIVAGATGFVTRRPTLLVAGESKVVALTITGFRGGLKRDGDGASA